jgi:hypothetical protein
MVESLASDVKLTAIFDCCHSGTLLDLEFLYNSEGIVIPESSQQNLLPINWRYNKSLTEPDVVMFSGCQVTNTFNTG